jgi:WD40 repeat protein
VPLWGVQIEPLADCHRGAVTGLASAPDCKHLVSCGRDGSVRVWAAAAGQLVGKRDLGGCLTCCTTAVGSAAAGAAAKPVLAVGSEAGVVR